VKDEHETTRKVAFNLMELGKTTEELRSYPFLWKQTFV